MKRLGCACIFGFFARPAALADLLHSDAGGRPGHPVIPYGDTGRQLHPPFGEESVENEWNLTRVLGVGCWVLGVGCWVVCPRPPAPGPRPPIGHSKQGVLMRCGLLVALVLV